MVLTYVRKCSDPLPSEDDLRKAVNDFISGALSIRAASRQYDLKKSMLGVYVKRVRNQDNLSSGPIKRVDHPRKIFTSTQES